LNYARDRSRGAHMISRDRAIRQAACWDVPQVVVATPPIDRRQGVDAVPRHDAVLRSATTMVTRCRMTSIRLDRPDPNQGTPQSGRTWLTRTSHFDVRPDVTVV